MGSERSYAAGKLLPALAVVCMAAASASAQQDRITTPVDPNQVVVLKGSVSPLARPQYDQGPVDPSFQLPYMMLMLKPSAAQQAALGQLLAAQQDPASPEYRHWLTPEEYAGRFGLSPNDMGKIRAWLESSGFKVVYTARGRDWIAFSGTAGQVQAALRTQVHHYLVNGETHFAIAADPSVPAVLEPVAAVFAGLHDFNPKAPRHPKPAFTSGPGEFSLLPGDLATIYDINLLYQQGIDGTGQKIAIIGATQLVLSDLQSFRSTLDLGNQNVQTVLIGTDPGLISDPLEEADLDLEWAGGVARNASFIYVYSTDPIVAAPSYAIDQNLAPVISDSYAGCEADMAAEDFPAMEAQAQKAISFGITWLVASGDEGAAGCDADTETAATLGLAIKFPSSIPEVISVGGTEFNEEGGNYWSGTNGPFGGSALSYIPEMAWNDTSLGGGLSGSGGGLSAFYSKPSWQAGPGVPNDGARDVPDVAMDASDGHDPYNIFYEGQWTTVGGTSASTPVLAGIIALLNQDLSANGSQAGVGNINTVLYPMAQNSQDVFHDIVVGNNIVPCEAGTPDCANGQFGYYAGPGYDLVTGLGTVDAYNLVVNWPGASASQVSISSLSPVSATAGGAGFTLTVNGSNFGAGATVNFSGASLPATVVSSTKLQASVSASLIATAGTAAVTVSSGGEVSNTVYFAINPAAPPSLTLSEPTVTAQAPPASGCVLPPPGTTFPTTDNTVYLYFAANVTAQDTLSNDWLAPDGATATGASWPAQAGDFCFTGASLTIAGLTGSKLGSWNARIYDNGTLLTSIPFSVTVTASSVPVVNSVKSAASYAAAVVSPGEIVVLFGSAMGPAQFAGLTLNSAGLVATQAGGTTVQFNGVAAPMIYSLAGQVAAIVPYEVSGSTAQVTVSYQGQTSAPFTVNVAASVPALFTAQSSGSGQAAALNQDYSLNSLTHPAAAGSVIQLFGTGEGQTTPAGVDGKLATAPYPKPIQSVSVTIGGMPATVDYAGGAPGEVAGVFQIDATIPAGVFGSTVPVVVTVGNGTSQSNTTIAVAAPAGQSSFTVTSQETAASVVTNSDGSLNCTTPASQTAFPTTSPSVWVYFTFNGAQTGDVFSFNWVHPSGQMDTSQPTITIPFAGAGCAAEALAILGAEAATEPGNWQVRVLHNNTLQFTLTFSIVAAAPSFAVTAKETAGSLVTDSNGNPEYCTMPPAKTSFTTADPFVWVWFTYNGVQTGDVFTFNWIHPSGQVDPDQPSWTANFSGSGCTAWSFPIQGAEAATEPGNWQVQVFRNGTSLFTLPFTIASATFAVTSQETAASVNLNSDGSLSCTAPTPQTIFLTTAPAVYVWLAFTGIQNGDVLSFHWIHPSGVVDPDQPSTTIGFSGGGCAYSSFNIAGSAANDPGAWQVEAFRNGSPLFTLPFTVGTSTTFAVTSQMTAASVPENSSGNLTCAAPTPQNAFQPTASAVWVWLAFDGAQVGDVLTVNWIHPSGAVDAYQPSSTIGFNGSGCDASGINISGSEPASDPGTWQVRVLRNGAVLFTLPFTIAN